MKIKSQNKSIPLIALALLALLFALWAGLQRLGWSLPSLPGLSMAHGPLIVSGFLGTLITLERAVAIRQRWMFLAPALTGLGWIVLLLFPTLPIGAILLALGSLVGVGILAFMVRREPHIHTVTMFIGMLIWLVSNILGLAGLPIYQIVFCWQAFLILTIVGERLELNRVLRLTRRTLTLFTCAASVYLLGVVLSIFLLDWGTRLAGLGMLALTIWLVRYDIAGRNLRHRLPLTRYIAWCLYLGFIWMGVGGALALYFGAMVAGPIYDAGLHSVFVGFVLSMIFGHAPIIFPALLQVQLSFNRAFYIHLVLLHASLILRIFGDLAYLPWVRQWGGLLNEVAILLFLGMTVYALRAGLRAKKSAISTIRS